MKDLLAALNEIIKDITEYFNTVGKLYLKYQLIFRVLFVNILLNDIFGGEKLICDTNQVGCNEMCVNRFAPITFKKLWELELWMVLIVTGVFIVFVFANQEVIKLEKNHHRLAKMMSVRKYETDGHGGKHKIVDAERLKQMEGDVRVQDDGKVIVYSRLISFGYVVMLLMRIFMEFYFLNLEYELAVHQSGHKGWNAFVLPEKYHCRTNMVKVVDVSYEDNYRLPDANKSSVFYIDEKLEACSQQRFEVVCWIPNSRMKTKGLYFMYAVLIVSTCLSILELVTVLFTFCKTGKTKSRELQTQLKNVNSEREQERMVYQAQSQSHHSDHIVDIYPDQVKISPNQLQ